MSKPVVLVTGALTGIGRATGLAFARQGDIVVVSGRREAEGKALEAELRGLGTEAAFIAADVRHEDDIRDLVDQTMARFGRIETISDLLLDEHLQIGVNLFRQFLLLPILAEQVAPET